MYHQLARVDPGLSRLKSANDIDTGGRIGWDLPVADLFCIAYVYQTLLYQCAGRAEEAYLIFAGVGLPGETERDAALDGIGVDGQLVVDGSKGLFLGKETKGGECIDEELFYGVYCTGTGALDCACENLFKGCSSCIRIGDEYAGVWYL